MDYQRKRLSDGAKIGPPGSLPAELQGLDDATLSDLSRGLDPEACAARGFTGHGFFPVTGRWIHKAVFLLRLTREERIAITAAADIDPIAKDFLSILYQSDEVDLDSIPMQQGVGYLVAQQLLTPERAATIRA